MSEVEQTPNEVFDSLTGHDERAILEHFGQTADDLRATDPVMWGRSLVFVAKRRGEGRLNDDDARNFVLEMPRKDLVDFFADEPDQDSEEGKDEPLVEEPSDEQTPTSLTSVS